MGRKYLEDLGISLEYADIQKNDSRNEQWEIEQKTYGFDEKETWDLRETFKIWLYERLCMYNEVNSIDASYHKFNFKGEEITFQDCIDRILEGLKIDLTVFEESERERNQDKIQDVLPLFVLCFDHLWW